MVSLVVGLVGPAWAQVTTLDSGPGVVQGTSITIGADGLGLIAYYSALNGELKVAHCSNLACTSATITTLDTVTDVEQVPQVATGSDGLGLILYHDGTNLQAKTAHCRDLECTSADIFSHGFAEAPVSRLVIGSDGLGLLLSFRGPGPRGTCRVAHCADQMCSSVLFSSVSIGDFPGGAAVGADGRALISYTHNSFPPRVAVLHCSDVICSDGTTSLLTAVAQAGELGIGSDGLGLFRIIASVDKVAHCWDADCSIVSTVPAPGRGSLTIGPDGLGLMTRETPALRISHCEDTTCSTQTLSGPIEGPAFTSSIRVGADGLALISYMGEGHLKVAHCSMASCDLPGPYVSITDATVVEGDTGTVEVTLSVSLSEAAASPVSVDWLAYGGSATEGVDFLSASGTVFFAPGELTRAVVVSVVGDQAVEPDESFQVQLSNATNAVIVDQLGQVTIVDDDAPSLSFLELVHGSELRQDLQAQPGPVADLDYYRLAQPPRSSWEVVVDGASGGVAPLIIERLGADNVTVLQFVYAPTGGSSVSLRWSNDTALPVTNQHLRVRSVGCGASCDASATYRIRAYETNGRIPRFNNSATQTTVVVLENRAASAAQGTLWFRGSTGTLLDNQPFGLGPKTSYVLSTATRPALAGASGSITVTWDGRYGDLQGKAVAIEPATGFTFDSDLTLRPR